VNNIIPQKITIELFIPSIEFSAKKKGYVFKNDDMGSDIIKIFDFNKFFVLAERLENLIILFYIKLLFHLAFIILYFIKIQYNIVVSRYSLTRK
jgi:hypothetical protein